MLAELELKNDDSVSAKETFRAAGEATNGKDSSATLSPVGYFLLCTFILVLFKYHCPDAKNCFTYVNFQCAVFLEIIFASHLVLVI